jgi:hypothetical protein
VRAFTAQPGVAWVYSATANANSAPVYKAFAYRRCERRQADTRLRWVTSKRAVLRSALERLHLGALIPLPPSLADSVAGPEPAEGIYACRVFCAELAAAGAETRKAWDLFAQAVATQPGVQSDRSATTLAWRLADPDMAHDKLALWALRDPTGRVLGMALARRLPRQHGKPGKAELMDMAVLPACSRADVLVLLRACQAWARSHGVAVLDAKRWTGPIADQLSQLGARAAPLPGDALWLRQGSDAGSAPGVDWPVWSMTGTDSDDWFNTLQTSLLEEQGAGVSGAAHPANAEPSAVTRSAAVSTSEGSNRSMSTV